MAWSRWCCRFTGRLPSLSFTGDCRKVSCRRSSRESSSTRRTRRVRGCFRGSREAAGSPGNQGSAGRRCRRAKATEPSRLSDFEEYIFLVRGEQVGSDGGVAAICRNRELGRFQGRSAAFKFRAAAGESPAGLLDLRLVTGDEARGSCRKASGSWGRAPRRNAGSSRAGAREARCSRARPQATCACGCGLASRGKWRSQRRGSSPVQQTPPAPGRARWGRWGPGFREWRDPGRAG